MDFHFDYASKSYPGTIPALLKNWFQFLFLPNNSVFFGRTLQELQAQGRRIRQPKDYLMAQKPTYEKLEQTAEKLKEKVDKHKRAIETPHASENNSNTILDKETLVNGFVHDLNNSLQSIFSYTQLLLLEKQSDDPDFTKLKEIEKAAEKANEIIHRLLTPSQKI